MIAIMEVKGMTCGSCSKQIKTSLDMNGIQKVYAFFAQFLCSKHFVISSVSLDSELVRIQFNSYVTTVDDIVAAFPTKFSVNVVEVKSGEMSDLVIDEVEVDITDPTIMDVKFAITGMTCTSCSKSIEKVSMELDGVISRCRFLLMSLLCFSHNSESRSQPRIHPPLPF